MSSAFDWITEGLWLLVEHDRFRKPPSTLPSRQQAFFGIVLSARRPGKPKQP
jgi:hypothetical protein